MTHNTKPRKIIQWNCQGISRKKDELLQIISDEQPLILALQETMLTSNTFFRVPNYNIFHKAGTYNRRQHGGAALLVHESVPMREITPLQTDLQAVAVQVFLNKQITVCSLYNSRSHRISEHLLTELLRQLPPPVILMGDFNAYDPLWGSTSSDSRGRHVANFVLNNNLNVLNDGSPTRKTLFSETCIDLTFVTPILQPDLQWAVDSSTLDSDHNPIVISFLDDSVQPPPTTSYNINRANWDTFKTSLVWSDLPVPDTDVDPLALVEDLYQRFQQACEEAIPRTVACRFFPKPWWSPAIIASRNRREALYKNFCNTKSPENMKMWKKARAKHRALLTKHKRDHWRNFVSEINVNTPTVKVWDKLRGIRGRASRRVTILKDEHRSYTTESDIANKLADSFSAVSSTENYSPTFQRAKRQAEATELDLSSNNTEDYNELFTIEELSSVIDKLNTKTSPGPDGIHNQMLKALPPPAVAYMLHVFNSLWCAHTLPMCWKEAIIIPIPKPNKDDSVATNYRPIALTSVLCKTMERMINARLLHRLERNRLLSRFQSGGRHCHSTVEQLLRLESTIRNGFVLDKHTVTVNFDMEKAYDMTWRYGILRDLHRTGFRGRMVFFIKNFLSDRFFNVKLNQTLSTKHSQQNGIPQGSVVSPTLFLLKINGITENINDPCVMISLYMDDFQLSVSHRSLPEIGDKLQQNINHIAVWSDREGYKVSPSKTTATHFTDKPGIFLPPALSYKGRDIQYTDTFKFLGLRWDSKMSWKQHIAELKTSCLKTSNILKTISANSWGADQESIMRVYRALVRSKLDYGSIVYASAAPYILKELDRIANDALRLATGAFKSTPVSSLQVLCAEPSLQSRRQMLSLKYYYKIRSYIAHPVFEHAVDVRRQRLFSNKKKTVPFSIRICDHLRSLNIPKHYIRPSYSSALHPEDDPPWILRYAVVNFSLTEYPKDTTPPRKYRREYQKLCDDTYRDWFAIHTDGSKSDLGVGAAAVSDLEVKTTCLPKIASIFTAELHAISMALNVVNNRDIAQTVIFCDSKSALQALISRNQTNVLVVTIQHTLNRIYKTGKLIEFCWIPGHVDIQGNEQADKHAKTASGRQPELILLPYTDSYPVVMKNINNAWETQWKTSNSKLLSVKSTLKKWPSPSYFSRKDEVVFNRLRAGHTRITHEYLMDREVLVGPPPCELCMNDIMSVEHLLVNCENLRAARMQVFGRAPISLKKLLSHPIDPKVVTFVKLIGLYDRV